MTMVPLILFLMIGYSSSLSPDNIAPCLSDLPDDAGCPIPCPCHADEETCEWEDGNGCIRKSCSPKYCTEDEETCEWKDDEKGCTMKKCELKIEGCETVCPMQCNEWGNDFYCPSWDENLCPIGHCSNYDDSMCQGGWHVDTTTDDNYFDNFDSNCTHWNGKTLGDAKICVPQRYKHTIKMAPQPPSNTIFVNLSNVQITDIADKLGQITILMDLDMKWHDHRMELVKEKVPIFLSNEDQNQIWSPRFRIGTNLVSHHKQMEDELILKQHDYLSQTSVRKISYITATIKCKMEFHSFPFDNHTCIFEVRNYSFEKTF